MKTVILNLYFFIHFYLETLLDHLLEVARYMICSFRGYGMGKLQISDVTNLKFESLRTMKHNFTGLFVS